MTKKFNYDYKESLTTFAEFPTRATMWHDESTITVGNAFTLAIHNPQMHNFYKFQNLAADGDTFTNSFFAEAGTYTLSALGVRDPNSCKVDWYIDGTVTVSGQDWYNAGVGNDFVQTASVTVTGDGYHTFKGVVNGKNASSGGYNLYLTKYWLNQAAD